MKAPEGSTTLYHGSQVVVERPEIRSARFHKDFHLGFYCTRLRAQAERWATRYEAGGVLNVYRYSPLPALRVKAFAEMTEEWLDFIAACRTGQPHNYDIVEGPMADDTIFNYVQNFIDGRISREAFWALARFKKPTHQVCFHTTAALASLQFQHYETL